MDLDQLQSAFNSLQSKYDDLRERAERREHEFHRQYALALQASQRLRQELKQSQKRLGEQLNAMEALQKNHANCCRQMTILAAECERRYPAIGLSEERGRALEAMKSALAECVEERGQLAARVDHLQAQLQLAATSPPDPHPVQPVESMAMQTERIQQLERELEEAREESALRLLQLRLLEEELEQADSRASEPTDLHHGPCDPGVQFSSVPAACREADLINANRSRLLQSDGADP